MTDEPDSAVADRQMALALDELAGRERAPDRRAAILALVAAARARSGRGWRSVRPFAAALLLLGAAITIAVAVLQRSAAPPVAGAPVAAADGKQALPLPGNAPELPKGTDPADLKAMRSAAAMLAAEQKLAQQLATGKLVGVDRLVRFDDLSGWKYHAGLDGLPAEIAAIDGHRVMLTGFMLPIDEVDDMQQFLLVKSLWSCCYGTPPDINGVVRCVLPKGRTTDYQFEPLKVLGEFRVEPTMQDGYCTDIYQLHVDLLEVIQ